MSALAATATKIVGTEADLSAGQRDPETDRRIWSIAGAVALALHAAAIVAIVGTAVSTPPPEPEPVVLIELPPEAAAAPAQVQSQVQPQVRPETPLPQTLTPPVDVPPVKAPLPRDPVVLPPPPPPLPARAAQSAPAPAAVPATNVLATARTGTGTSATPGDNAKARKQDADYYALIAAHLNRRKSYPTEAKKARQEGVVTIRFTVNREGDVSAVSVKRSSGHALLDQVTIDLLRRVAPLPRMPASMARDSVTLSLPIDYSLKTN